MMNDLRLSRLVNSVRDTSRLARSVAQFYFHGAFLLPLGKRYWSWRYRNADPWDYANSPYEQRKYARTLAMLPPAPGGAYPRALEVGCSEGVFTEQLIRQGRASYVLGIDVDEQACDRARQRCQGVPGIQIEVGDALQMPLAGPFDAIFCGETLSHLGSLGRIRAMADRLVPLLAPGGYLVLVDSWPKGRFLHWPFRQRPELRLVDTSVEEDPQRPYVITVLQRR